MKKIPIGPGWLDVDVSIRTRYEYFNNFNVKGFGTGKDGNLLLLRTRLGLDYHITKDAHLYVQGQDARHWLSALDRHQFPETCPYFDQAELRQAYFQWEHIGGSPVGFKVGRQSISYADKRTFGPGDWGNVGRYWWDAVAVHFDTEPVHVDVLYGQRVISEQVVFNDRHFDYDMLAVYATFRKLPFQLDTFYVLRCDDHGQVKGEHGVGDQRTHTLGFYLDGKLAGRLDYGGTFAGQFGQYGRDEICAFGTNARLGYTFDAPWKPRVAFEFSYASGDRDPADGRHETFDGVFGAIDCFYGRMNLVAWMNLQDYQFTFGLEPIPKILSIWVDYHFLRLASDTDAWYWSSGKALRRDAAGESGHELGQELNLLLKWKLTKNLELFAGYAHFLPGSFVRHTPGNRHDADWFFVQLEYKF